MSQPPPSYPVPSGYPPGQSPLPTKYRPSGWWFVVGGGLIVAAIAAGVGLFIWTLSAFFSTDATVPADGEVHTVTVGTDGDRMIWRSSNDSQLAPCEVTDQVTGEPIALSPVTGSYTRSSGSVEWLADQRFDPGSGRLEITCAAGSDLLGAEQRVQIGPAPSIGGFVGGIFASIAVPGLLGLFGVATLIVTGILWFSRPAKPKG